jgi:hypothetical protein
MHGPTCIYWANRTPFSLPQLHGPDGSALAAAIEHADVCGATAKTCFGAGDELATLAMGGEVMFTPPRAFSIECIPIRKCSIECITRMF